MSANFDWSKYEKGNSKSENSFDWGKYEKSNKKQEPVTLRGSATSYGSGVAGGAGGLIPDVINLANSVAPHSPTVGAVSNLSNVLGLKGTHDLTEEVAGEMGGQGPQNALERILQQSGEFGGQEGLIGTGVGGPVGGALGLAHGSASGALYGGLKELGMDDDWALLTTAVASLSPIAAQKWITKFKSGSAFKEAAKAAEKEFPGISKQVPQVAESVGVPAREIDRFASGLTKPRAFEAEHAGKALLSPEAQKKALQSIDQEASKIARESIEKRVPKVKQIEEGFDFGGYFEKEFAALEEPIKGEALGKIDFTDVGDFLSESRMKYRGLPSELLTPEQKKILKEVKALRNNPVTDLDKLYKLFRLNNKKRSLVYETRLMHGKQAEYVDFLGDLNRSIIKSFERTFPEDSAWLNRFKELNAEFSEYRNAEKTLKTLETVLEGNAKPSTIAKLANNETAQKKLAIYMGKDGASEISQLAKDMQASKSAIKGIPARKIKEMNLIYPLGLVIPGIKIPSTIAMASKGIEGVRRVYGWYLTTPARRAALDEAVRAASSGNIQAYKAATDVLKIEGPHVI